MSRRRVLAGIGAIALMPFARAQEKVRRIGYLVMTPLADKPSVERAALFEGLRALGYVEGRNLAVEYRSSEMEAQFLEQFAAELVKAGVELIFAVESIVVSAVLKVSSTIPIVFVSAADPVAMGFAQNLARPGRNVTGITLLGYNLGPKRLELLRDLLPGAKRVAVLSGQSGSGPNLELAAIKPAAAKLRFELESFSVRNAADILPQLARIAARKSDALFIAVDSRTIAARTIIAEFAQEKRLPSIMGFSGYTQAGGLISLASNFTEQFRRAASYVDRILKGARPAELPIEQPTTFEVVINSRTARALGITIPSTTLLRADRVIE